MTNQVPQVPAVDPFPLRVEHVSKSYGGPQVLQDVSLAVAPGDIHAVLGANGSGKSTLVKIISAIIPADSGRVELFGDEVRTLGLAGAREAGLRVVHQHAPLVLSQTVTEATAMGMGYPTTRFGRVRWSVARRQAREVCDAFHIKATPEMAISELNAAARGVLSMAFAIHGADPSAMVLLLDESTASMPESEASTYLTEVGRLAEQGAAVVMITHRLGEVLEYATEVSVIAAGHVVTRGPAGEFTEDQLAAAVTSETSSETVEVPAEAVARRGRALEALWAQARRSPGTADGPALRVEGLGGDQLRDLSLAVEPGEIVGILGLPASGREELPALLAQSKRRSAGRIWVRGTEVSPGSGPDVAIKAGLAMLPADRLRQGGAASLQIAENLLMPEYARYWGKPRLRRETVEKSLEEFEVRGGGPEGQFGALSGGNQQKVVFAKWLLTGPTVLVLDDPTQGVDAGSRKMIFETIEAAAEAGVAILLFSSEPMQIAEVCQRVLVLSEDGVDELCGDQISPETMTRLAAA